MVVLKYPGSTEPRNSADWKLGPVCHRQPLPCFGSSASTPSCQAGCVVFVWLTGLALAGLGPATATEPPVSSFRCKYSVRDVGFVDVHAFGWQLTLAKPKQMDREAFQELDSKVRRVLLRSNVSHLWIPSDSDEFQARMTEAGTGGQVASAGAAILSHSAGESFLVSQWDHVSELNESWVNSLSDLVDSDLREELLRACSESLCSILLFETDDADQNLAGNRILQSAIKKLSGQMWMLEKPTEKPPRFFVLSRSAQAQEKWLTLTLGAGRIREPSFAIVYGQGRRLGGMMPLSQSTPEKLVGRASICGGDCECDLDRDFLYGHQLAHRWSLEMERVTESTLNFDPHAAYVKSEIATIVRKAGRAASDSRRLELGPGLIIHDLEPIDGKSGDRMAAGNPNGRAPLTGAAGSELPAENNEAGGASGMESKASSTSETSDIGDESKAVRSPEGSAVETGGSLLFPSALVVLLLVGIAAAVLWNSVRSG